jgi:hypothetical protein
MEERFHGGIWHGYHRGGTGKFWVYVRVSQAYAQRGKQLGVVLRGLSSDMQAPGTSGLLDQRAFWSSLSG